jgi:hypothetical protein
MFAAYKNEISESSELTQKINDEFLSNPSFESCLVPSTSHIISSSSESDSSEEEKKAIVIYKKPPSPPKAEVFYIDDEPRKEYLKLQTLPARCLPRYRLSYRFSLVDPKFNLSKKFKRYFHVKKKKDKADTITMDTSTTGEELRIYLSKNSDDFDKWQEYIDHEVNSLRVSKDN